jgi:glycosyltransferase involved in cell wall biosynthesis
MDAALDALVDHETAGWTPDIVLTFGGRAPEVRRRQRLRDRGSAVVFGLRNLSYKSREAFPHVDAVLTPSPFLTEFYGSMLGVRSTAIPSPIDPSDIVASSYAPRHLTIVNPSLEKGLMVFARVAHEVSTRRPDVSIMVVESRGTAGLLVRAGLAGGFDLRPHRNILVSPGVSRPALIYAATRVLLVPSLWEEPFGRVAVEALVNGVPPMVSSRGGLPHAVGSGGFVLDVPASLTPQTRRPPSPQEVEAWTELSIRLMTDDAFHAEASARARAAGEAYLPDRVAPRYVEFFSGVVRTPGDTRGPGLDDLPATATA